MIASRLLCDRSDVERIFYDRGISGNRIVDLYARWKVDGLNLRPDLISILIGVIASVKFCKLKNIRPLPPSAHLYFIPLALPVMPAGLSAGRHASGDVRREVLVNARLGLDGVRRFSGAADSVATALGGAGTVCLPLRAHAT